MIALAELPVTSPNVLETDDLFRLQHRVACRADELVMSIAVPDWLAWLQAEREILGAACPGQL
jgi:hypothetical protein